MIVMIAEKYPPAFLHGVESFNRGAYFDAHDRWEECWIAEGRPAEGFFKGLIQAAVAMHHLSKGNLGGAQKLLVRSRECLGRCRPSRFGLAVDDLLDQMAACMNPSAVNSPVVKRFDPRRGPQIQLNPPAFVLSE
jgi:predicted metal-dependent hydrolase